MTIRDTKNKNIGNANSVLFIPSCGVDTRAFVGTVPDVRNMMHTLRSYPIWTNRDSGVRCSLQSLACGRPSDFHIDIDHVFFDAISQRSNQKLENSLSHEEIFDRNTCVNLLKTNYSSVH